jgi:hypothetical protein
MKNFQSYSYTSIAQNGKTEKHEKVSILKSEGKNIIQQLEGFRINNNDFFTVRENNKTTKMPVQKVYNMLNMAPPAKKSPKIPLISLTPKTPPRPVFRKTKKSQSPSSPLMR